MILDIKEEHLEEWSILFNENLDEYFILHNSTMKKMGVGKIINNVTGLTDYTTTCGDVFNIVTYISHITTKQIKKKYKKDYKKFKYFW